jgi:hypothetical protein
LFLLIDKRCVPPGTGNPPEGNQIALARGDGSLIQHKFKMNESVTVVQGHSVPEMYGQGKRNSAGEK